MPTRAAAESGGDKRPFTLGAVNVDGATVFSQAQLSAQLEPYLATEVDRSKLSDMAATITDRYRRAGYLLSYATVPAQNVQAGMVRFDVVEGRIGNVWIQGAKDQTAAMEAVASSLISGQALKATELERTLGLLRDYPGITVTDVALTKSDIEAGLYTLKITVAPDRLRAFTYADNRGTGSVGHSRVYNSVAWSSLAIPGDELRVELFGMPGAKQRYLYGQLSASVPLDRSGLRLQLSVSRGDQFVRTDEKFSGQSGNVTAQLSYPLMRSRALTLAAKGSLTEWRTVGTLAGTRSLRDRLRVARFGFEFFNEGTTRLQGDVVLSRGLGFGAMTRVGDPLASRPDAGGTFTKFTASAQVSRQLGDRITARAVAVGQYADRPLLSAEEYSLGGSRIGRAYRFNAATGDRGWGAGAEIGYQLKAAKQGQLGLELFGFADAGRAINLKSALAPRQSQALSSAGAGARVSLAGTTVAIEAAAPLSGNRHAPHLFASIFRNF